MKVNTSKTNRSRGFVLILALATLAAVGVAAWYAWELGNQAQDRNATIEQGLDSAVQ